MALLLDGAVFIILAVTCIVGYVKGFVKYLIGMVSTLAAVIIALWMSSELAEPVYQRYMKEPINKSVTKAVEDIDPTRMVRQILDDNGLGEYVQPEDIRNAILSEGNVGDNISALLIEKGADGQLVNSVKEKTDLLFSNEIPETINKQLQLGGAYGMTGGVKVPENMIRDMSVKLLDEDKSNAVGYICDDIIKPAAVAVAKAVVFMIAFVSVVLVLKLAVFISGIASGLPEISAANRFAGLLLGLIKGVILCALIAFMLCTVVNATHDQLGRFNTDIVEKTYVFKYFFDFFYK